AYVPIDPAYPKERIDFIIKDTNAKILITDIDTEQKISLQEQGCQKAVLSEIVKKQYQEHSLKPRPQDIAYIIYTSGSTGKPKGVMVRHDSLLNYTMTVSQTLNLPEMATYAVVSTFAADLCYTMLYPSLCRGGDLHIIPDELIGNAKLLADYFGEHKIDCLKITPSHMTALMAADGNKQPVPEKILVLGGEPGTWKLAETVLSENPECRIFNHYGPTETTVGTITNAIVPKTEKQKRQFFPLGRPMPNINLYVLDAARNPVPFGVPGELFIAGVQVAEGYLNRPELTRQRFIPDHIEGKGQLYQTGDMVVMQPDGLLEYLGRIDDQVKIRGFRIEPAEIEQAIMEIEGIQQAVVVTVKDPQQRNRLAAYLVCQEMDKQAITDALSLKLPAYMVPASFTKIEQIPLTPNGKIDKNRLPSPETSTQKQREHAPPTDKTQELLCQIWQSLFKNESIGIYDNFFELGGDSIITIQVVSRARRAGIEIQPRDVFQHQ
ncbi:amino acid adenylation domain-containing protein, partial [Pedobacter terrae]